MGSAVSCGGGTYQKLRCVGGAAPNRPMSIDLVGGAAQRSAAHFLGDGVALSFGGGVRVVFGEFTI